MKINAGRIDRVIRVLVGLALLALGLLGLVPGGLVYAAYVLGAILLVTGIVGFCPLYALLKLNTNK